MRRIIGIVLGAALCLAVGACGGGGGGSEPTPAASAPAAPTFSAKPTASPSPTPTRAPTPTTIPGSVKSNPIQIGSPATYSDGWEITVLGATPDATAQVLAQDPANVAPETGRQFFLASVQVRYLGSEPTASFPAGFALRAVGPSGTLYDLETTCGVIPGEFPSDEITPGGTLSGNVCWNVKTEDASGLLMYYRPIVGVNVGIQYSDLTP